MATGRAGNVVGGGDWAIDRIVPDCVRSLAKGEPIHVRNKIATRPWQHVLEPLSGYLWLGACLTDVSRFGMKYSPEAFASAFNFGPNLNSNRTVSDLVDEIVKYWPGEWLDCSDPSAAHEAKLLNLATDKAHHFMGWEQVWEFEETIARTVFWYKSAKGNPSFNAQEYTLSQIQDYTAKAQSRGLAWAR